MVPTDENIRDNIFIHNDFSDIDANCQVHQTSNTNSQHSGEIYTNPPVNDLNSNAQHIDDVYSNIPSISKFGTCSAQFNACLQTKALQIITCLIEVIVPVVMIRALLH